MSEHIDDLIDFVASSPSSFHAAQAVADRLASTGFTPVEETQPFPADPGGYLIVRDGAVVAWRIPDGASASTPFRIVGAHTDSPGLKL